MCVCVIQAPNLCLYCVGGQQYRGFRRAVDILCQNSLLHLEVEEMLRELLYQLLTDIFREELHFKMELNWSPVLRHANVLVHHL